MSEDSFSTVSHESWFSRIGKSFVGAVFGLGLFAVSFFILFWNEGRTVFQAQALQAAGGAVVSVAADKVDPANEGKLVHLSGKANTTETLSDQDYGVSANALRLDRNVQMYQWQQNVKTEKRKRVGGGEDTIKTYTYEKVWSKDPIDSSRFEVDPSGGGSPKVNPPFPSDGSKVQTAGVVTLGAFTLTPELVAKISSTESLPVTDADLQKIPEDKREDLKVDNGVYYRGKSSANPEIGDLKISFQVVKPQPVSVMARQSKDSFASFHPEGAQAGYDIYLLHLGDKTAKDMLSTEEQNNNNLCWILRGVGFLAMAFGIYLMLAPLQVLSDVLPFLGSLVGFALQLFAFLIAAVLTLITIAVSWLYYRPLLGVSLLLLAGLGIVGIVLLLRSRPARPRPVKPVSVRA